MKKNYEYQKEKFGKITNEEKRLERFLKEALSKQIEFQEMHSKFAKKSNFRH